MAIDYLDFDLLIERSGDKYKARVLESPAGEASIEFAVPFTAEDINNFFVQIGQTRSFETQQTRRIREFGQSLFEAVFSGPVRDRLRSSMGEAGNHSNGLRIRLRLAGIPELSNLPWEFLYDPGASRFLALSVESPIIRYLESPQMAQPFAVQPPLRILAAICGPQDYPRLDTEQEWKNLQESMRGLQSRGLVELQRLDPPTLSALQQQLRRDQYHILHFVGHGVFSKNDQDGYLMFENALRGGQRISGHDLGTILHDHRPLRLAVLNACEGARASMEDQFAGTAQSLILQGIPAVIAMQFRITDQASITLAHEFYGALADGYPVDAALTEARKAIKTEGNDLEWGTPVLYMRSPDGRIFNIAGQPGAKRPKVAVLPRETEDTSRLERLYTEGLEAFYLSQWETACEKFQAIVDANPNFRDAAAKLETARRKTAAETLNRQAQNAENNKDWESAATALRQLTDMDPAYPDVSARMERANRQLQLEGLRAEAEQLAQAGKWDAIAGITAQMKRIDPQYPEIRALQGRAEQELAKIRTSRELESAYAAALKELDAKDWQGATRNLRRVRQLQKGYRESDELLARAEVEIRRKPAREAKPKAVVQPVVKAAPVPSPSTGMYMEGSLPVLFGVFLVAGSLFAVLNAVMDNALTSVNYDFLILLHWLPGGLLGGWVFTVLINRAIGPLNSMQRLAVAGTYTLSMVIVGLISEKASISTPTWYFLWAAFGGVFGFVLGRVMQSKGEMPEQKRLYTFVAGWALIYLVSTFTGRIAGEKLYDFLTNELYWRFQVSFLLTLAAFLGGWWTLSQLKANNSHRFDWKTVIAGSIGIAIGAVIPVALSLGAPIGAAIWGLTGSAAMVFPSRGIKQAIWMGLASALALGLIAVLEQAVLGYTTDLEEVLNYLPFWAMCGTAIGFILSWAAPGKKAKLTLPILGLTAFTIGCALGSVGSVVALTGVVVCGAVLAAGFGYLNGRSVSPEPTGD